MFLLLPQFPDLSLLAKKIAVGASGANLYKLNNNNKKSVVQIYSGIFLSY